MIEFCRAQIDRRGGKMGEARVAAACFVASQRKANEVFGPGMQVLDTVGAGLYARRVLRVG